MPKLEGKVAFITGAARGQGRSHAIRLAEEGADIIAIDVCKPIPASPAPVATRADLDQTIAAVEARDRRILAAEIDIRDLAGLTTFVADSVAELGRLDIVVQNAAIAGMASTLEMDEELWQTVIDINLTGAWKVLKASVPHIIAGGRGGSVVIVSSGATIVAHEHTAHYAAAKDGLTSLMRVLAKELGPQRIRVNTVHPTNVATPMVLNEAIYKQFCPDIEHPTREDFERAAVAINRLPVPYVEPEDITNAVLFLVSDDGRYVTGTKQVIDAGSSLV